jgi:hypothetical protein
MTFRSIGLLFALSFLIHPSTAHAQWASNGNAISTGSGTQIDAVAISDGAGGAIIAWSDNRNGTFDIFAQRVNAWGVVQWTANGVPVRVATNQQTHPAIASDGADGAFVFWEHLANNGSTDIQAQHISGTGTQSWVNPTTVCSAQFDQLSPRAVSDGAGGAIVAWQDNRPGSNAVADIYAQRVNASGGVVWTSDGVNVCVASNKQEYPRLVSDGAGGAIIAWSDNRDGLTWAVYARRVNSTGTAQWTSDGNLIGANTGWESPAAIAIDGAGGAVIAWQSNNGGSDTNIYAQRVAQGGSIQWGSSGVTVCGAAENQTQPDLVFNNNGSVIVAWQDLRNTVTFVDEDIYAQRLDLLGVPQWAPDGVVLCDAAEASTGPQMISDGAGGAVVVWTDTRVMDYNLFAQRVNAAGGVLWAIGGAAVTLATSGQTGPAPVSDGAGGVIVAWNDTRSGNFDVYANRITGGGIIPTPVRDTPAAPSLAVNAYPNPFSSRTSIEITSESNAPVTVDVFDVSGRRVRSLNAPRGITRSVSFDGRDNRGNFLPSGLYFCRIQAGDATATRKIVIQR